MTTAVDVVKGILPDSGIAFLKKTHLDIRKAISLVDRGLLQMVVRSPFLSSLYYSLVSSQFRREQHSVIFGKLKYYRELKSSQDSTYLLRRNVHRLEKGLIMRPRRDVFAVGYIEDTVTSYCSALQSHQKDDSEDEELRWAHDVLTAYFKVVASHPSIDKAKAAFLESTFLVSEAIEPEKIRVPYKRKLDTPSSISYDQFLELCHRRRSVRWYQQKPVPRELIDQAIRAAALSPSACNRQPFEFRIFDDPDLVQKVASIPGGTQGFSHNFPVIIVVVGKLSAYFSERDRHVIYIDGSLASMSLMYALETLELSSCAINWPDVDAREKQMSNLLQLEPDERALMLISVGYPDPDALVPYSCKKSLDNLRTYN